MGTSDSTPLVVPQMGVIEGVLVVEWLVEDGAMVSQGEAVVVVETEKAETELQAPTSGRLKILIHSSDAEVPVGSALAHIIST